MFQRKPASARLFATLTFRRSWSTQSYRLKIIASSNTVGWTCLASGARCCITPATNPTVMRGRIHHRALQPLLSSSSKYLPFARARTFKRKYAEAMLSLALERRLSSEDIFALYCNEVYLGQRGAVAVRGVGEAARIYFGKELADLSLGEAATIAGMIQGPARYSPLNHQEAAQQRRNMVLAAMARDVLIDAAQAAGDSERTRWCDCCFQL